MGNGSFDYDPTPGILNDIKTPTGVFLFDGTSFTFLPNVIPQTVQTKAGPHPSVASFRYVADQYNPFGWPVRTQDILPLNASGAFVVPNGARICVGALDPFGNLDFLFDGFAKIPESHLSASTESISFQAVGVEERLWDSPLSGSWWRDSDFPETANKYDDHVGIPIHFNPDGKPNATKDGTETSWANGFESPVFLDKDVCFSRGIGQLWNLSSAARYIIGQGSPSTTFVNLPTWQDVDNVLVNWEPIGDIVYDPNNSLTFTISPIILRDITVQGHVWPVALHSLLSPFGFGMRFQLETVGGAPSTRLVIWRKDVADRRRYKTFYLNVPALLDPSKNNVREMALARDTTETVNQVTVETALAEYEVTFVLAPGFQIAGADFANKANFVKDANANFPANADGYRVWVLDEAGDGHWDHAGAQWLTNKGTDLSTLLGGSKNDPSLYVKRRRPGKDKLFTLDPSGKPLRAFVSMSFDYAGTTPGIWDGSGSWRTISKSWTLLPDRLGIVFNMHDPNAVDLGASGQETGQKASPKLSLIDILTGNNTAISNVIFALTVVIEGDQLLSATAPRRPASPSPWTIERQVDAKDRFKEHIVTAQSGLNTTGKAIFARDDSDDAQREAEARRLAMEIPPLAGSVDAGRLLLAYQIGDRITSIVGRDIDLQTNAGTGQGEAPTYLEIEGITWHGLGEGDQRTEYHLSDNRTEAAKLMRKHSHV